MGNACRYRGNGLRQAAEHTTGAHKNIGEKHEQETSLGGTSTAYRPTGSPHKMRSRGTGRAEAESLPNDCGGQRGSNASMATERSGVFSNVDKSGTAQTSIKRTVNKYPVTSSGVQLLSHGSNTQGSVGPESGSVTAGNGDSFARAGLLSVFLSSGRK